MIRNNINKLAKKSAWKNFCFFPTLFVTFFPIFSVKKFNFFSLPLYFERETSTGKVSFQFSISRVLFKEQFGENWVEFRRRNYTYVSIRHDKTPWRGRRVPPTAYQLYRSLIQSDLSSLRKLLILKKNFNRPLPVLCSIQRWQKKERAAYSTFHNIRTLTNPFNVIFVWLMESTRGLFRRT